MGSTEIEYFSDVEWQLTACLRIITYEKGSCSKIEELCATLTGKISLQKATMQRFPVCFRLLLFETKKNSHKQWNRSVFFFNFTKDILEDYRKYDISVALNDRIHSLTFCASARSLIQNVDIAEGQISVPAVKPKCSWYDYQRRTKRRKSEKE